MTDIVVHHVEAAIEGLDVPGEVRQQIEYEVLPFLAPEPPSSPFAQPQLSLKFIIGVGLPTLAGDHHIPLHPLDDPHDPAEITRLVQQLFETAQAMVAEADGKIRAAANGHKASPGGLIIPK
jgi:hypothetical protein